MERKTKSKVAPKRRRAKPAEPARKRAMLRTCSADMRSHGGFCWPESGPVAAPDWNSHPRCGGGLHGLLDGCGSGSLLCWDADAKWLVVEIEEWVVLTDDDLDKVKAPRGVVVYCGDRAGAAAYGVERYGWDAARCVGGQATAGYGGQATAGDYGQATAGDYGQATAGYRGHATAGYRGQATAGDYGQATAGDYGQATAGYGGHATAGDYGQATAGYRGHATAGDYGQATAGYGGQATAGDYGLLSLPWYDGKRYRLAVFYVGEGGIEPNVAYRVDDHGKPVRVNAVLAAMEAPCSE